MVGTASSGIDAMGLVEETEPDVVLMDVRMPEMNGIEATRRLKSAFPEIGIVALTGVDDQDAVREMLVAGASCYVLKDSDSDEIFHAIRQAAAGGGVISSEVTPRVIGELTEALERERRRARQLELAQEALLERAARRHELVSRLGHELRTPGDRDPRDGPNAVEGDRDARPAGRDAERARDARAGARTTGRPARRRGRSGAHGVHRRDRHRGGDREALSRA